MAPRASTDLPYGQQPWRAAYMTYRAFELLLRFPLWTLYLIPPSNRPKPTWSYKRALVMTTVKHLLYTVAKAGPLTPTPDYLAIRGEGGAWVAPTPHLIVGQLKKWAELAGVECSRIPGYWMQKDGRHDLTGAPPAPDEKVIYFIHGGAYALYSAHPGEATSNAPRGLLEHTPTIRRAFLIEYRRTKGPPDNPIHPFPTALLDAIAGYNYLVREVGFDPSDIILQGDSAGGNLSLALVRYLIENRGLAGLPAPPSALVLCSPWVDLSGSDRKVGGSVPTNTPIDFLYNVFPEIDHMPANFVGLLGHNAALSNPYISPASQSPTLEVSFKGFPRMFILAGGSEVFTDQLRIFHERVQKDLGKDVEYLEQPDAVHDILVFPWYEPERSEALQRISKWIMQ